METRNTRRERSLNPKISYVTISAREDHPYCGLPDLHLFEPTFGTLRKQSFTDFEAVVVDWHYDKRPDYFTNLDLPFPVKHVPAQPNFWLERGMPAISEQYNKGIIYADGELVFFGVDGWVFPPDFMRDAWSLYLRGAFPMAWYMIDYTHAPKDHPAKMGSLPKAPFAYDYFGCTGETVEVDHRFGMAFGGNSKAESLHDTYSWFFSGCASAPLQSLLEINGFDMNFDGEKTLMDVDVGSRLQLIGQANFVLARNLYLIRLGLWQIRLRQGPQNVSIKCNYGLLSYARMHKQFRANAHILTDEDISWIKEVWCGTMCESREFCKANHPFQFPFEHKEGYEGHGSNRETFNLWKNSQRTIDLAEERELRLDGDQKYQKGTFTKTD